MDKLGALTVQLWDWQDAHRAVSDWLPILMLMCFLILWFAGSLALEVWKRVK